MNSAYDELWLEQAVIAAGFSPSVARNFVTWHRASSLRAAKQLDSILEAWRQ